MADWSKNSTSYKRNCRSRTIRKAKRSLVSSVSDGSPSDNGGVKAGDIILEFDGKKINEMKELPMIVAQTKVGKIVNVKIWRNKKLINKKITLGRLETSEDFKETKPKLVKNLQELKILKLKSDH